MAKKKEVSEAAVITVEQVNETVEKVKALNDELHPVVASTRCHKEQDKLVKDVLEAIANGNENPIELAQATLNIFLVEFTRNL
jgi:hypothetical protein